MLSTHQKGVIGLTQAVADLTLKGWLVSMPVSEHSPFDLIATNPSGGESYKIQVKYRRKKKGSIFLDFSSSWANSSGTHVVPMNKTMVDFVCLYCPDTSECYYFNPGDHGGSLTLRVDAPSKFAAHSTRYNWASDWKEFPI